MGRRGRQFRDLVGVAGTEVQSVVDEKFRAQSIERKDVYADDQRNKPSRVFALVLQYHGVERFWWVFIIVAQRLLHTDQTLLNLRRFCYLELDETRAIARALWDAGGNYEQSFLRIPYHWSVSSSTFVYFTS